MFPRDRYVDEIRAALEGAPVVVILGARQVGKTTLAREISSGGTWFDLESPRDLARLADPLLALEGLQGLVVLDEAQRVPGLFPVLRVLADRPGTPARFLVLGSASPEVLGAASETLAGRAAFVPIEGFGLDEVGADAMDRLWLRGGFPRSYLAATERASARWRDDFIDTFLARDLPSLGVRTAPTTMRRFWTMLAHWHGQVWNGSEFGRAFGVSDHSVRRYLDTLAASYVVRVLQPWHENLSKRQVRAPKVYVQDSGLLHRLLGVGSREDLEGHPKVGASWEGFAMAQVIRRLDARPHECFFWATHQGAELDLLVVRGTRRLGFEFKRTSAPALTPSMRIARTDLDLTALYVVTPGAEDFSLGTGVHAVGLTRLPDLGS